MSVESAPSSLPIFDPQTWVDLLTVHAMQNDMFSMRTLTVIHEGIERLARAVPGSGLVITSAQAGLFERLRKSFNNPHLLKEVGQAYLDAFRLPDMALKHFDLARQLAPNDRDIEQGQIEAALAVAREVSGHSGHSGIEEATPDQHEVESLLRHTAKLAQIAETRSELKEAAGELGRKTSRLIVAAPVADGQVALERAQALLSQNNFSGASSALQNARDGAAPSADLIAAYAQLGLAAYDQNDLDAALAAFGSLRELGPDVVEGWFNSGLVYQKLGRLDEALAAYKKALQLAPENPKTWCNLSSIWYELGDAAESERAARRCLQLKPDYARAWDNLASALSSLHRLDDAAAACQQAIRLQPALYSAWFKFGVVNFQLDNMVMATEAFQVANESPALHCYILYYLAMIEARRGEVDSAVEKLQDARGADPQNELEITTVKEIAAAFSKSGQHQRAADFHSQIAQAHPDDFSAWLAVGTALHRAEKVEGARKAYLRATELRPEHPVAWHNLGLLASDRGRYEEARDYFQREVELAPADAKAWYDLGVALTKLKREDEAAEAFEKAEGLVKTLSRRSSDLSAALSIVRRLNLSGRMLKTE